MPTNQEFTTWPRSDISRHNDTLFYLNLIDPVDDKTWKSKSGYFRLVHAVTRVSLWTHTKQLPEWAFKQQEINGNKNAEERTATWLVENIVAEESEHTMILFMNHTPHYICDQLQGTHMRLPTPNLRSPSL
jgi:dolichyl-phosphate-mannose-protein mannosyltransferase